MEYLGIAADEPKRFGQLNDRKRAPLVEFGIEEGLCGLYCQYKGILAPTYETSCRDGCWMCHNQGVNQLRQLRHDYQAVFDVVRKDGSTELLPSVMQSYVSGFIYSALIDSFCCEQNARMTAMDNANRNAEKLLGELSLQYNRVRQAAITQEITEISAGARAQRQKKGR